jgi:anthraniloyl-CoA monooxygenase
MRITIVGAGPAGLYFALLAKKQDPRHQIVVVERDPPGATYGWGIVFSDRTLSFLHGHDVPTYESITRRFVLWDNVDVVHRGERVTVRGTGSRGSRGWPSWRCFAGAARASASSFATGRR